MKPGIRSTEFWLTLLLMAAMAAGALAGAIPSKYSAAISGGAAMLYTLARFFLKWQGNAGDLAALEELRRQLESDAHETTAKRAERP